MRRSIRRSDPGFNPDVYECVIFLNGIEIDDVITADEEQGFLERYCTDEHGDYIPIGNELKTEIRHGIVRILYREDLITD